MWILCLSLARIVLINRYCVILLKINIYIIFCIIHFVQMIASIRYLTYNLNMSHYATIAYGLLLAYIL